jgi:hypothetical protein
MNLRSDPSTLVVKRPGPFAGARRGRRSRPSQAGDPGLQPWKAPGDSDRGCSSTRIEEGSTESLRNRRRKTVATLRIPCPSLGGARPMPPGTAMIRAPSLHRGSVPPCTPSSPRKRRRPREGDAERVVRRHGSSASSHGLHGPRPHRRVELEPAPKDLARENEVASPPAPAQAGSPEGLLGGQPTGSERGQGRRPRAEEDSRLAGVPPRRTCVAEIGSAVASSEKPESRPCRLRAATISLRWAGARSRVVLQDGIARCPPRRSGRRNDCTSDPLVDVHEGPASQDAGRDRRSVR